MTTIKTAVAVLTLAVAALAFDVSCPLHPAAFCHSTGQTRYINGKAFEVWKCSCGDSYLVSR